MIFTDLINEACRIVEEKYPDPKLYEVHTPIMDPIMGPDDIRNLCFIFRLPNYQTGEINWHDGAMGPLEIIQDPWVEDQIIPLPVNLELNEAVELMREAGIGVPFVSLTLRKPLYPGVKESSYVFGCPQIHSFVFVGTDSEEVTQFLAHS